MKKKRDSISTPLVSKTGGGYETLECRELVVGVNRFQVEDEKSSNLLRVYPSVRVDQVEALKRIKSERDGAGLRRAWAI